MSHLNDALGSMGPFRSAHSQPHKRQRKPDKIRIPSFPGWNTSSTNTIWTVFLAHFKGAKLIAPPSFILLKKRVRFSLPYNPPQKPWLQHTFHPEEMVQLQSLEPLWKGEDVWKPKLCEDFLRLFICLFGWLIGCLFLVGFNSMFGPKHPLKQSRKNWKCFIASLCFWTFLQNLFRK